MMGMFIRKKAEKRADAFTRQLDDVAARVSHRFARGNIALQNGRVLTKDEQRRASERRWGKA